MLGSVRSKFVTSGVMTVQVQNASTEDVNRSWLGRALGAILLLWLASVSLGLPFKYGLAAALLAISAVLFLDWDRARRGGARATPSPASAALAPVSPPLHTWHCHVSSIGHHDGSNQPLCCHPVSLFGHHFPC